METQKENLKGIAQKKEEIKKKRQQREKVGIE